MEKPLSLLWKVQRLWSQMDKTQASWQFSDIYLILYFLGKKIEALS